MRVCLRSTLLATALLAASTTIQAQSLDRAVPAAGGVGDLIILQGSGLDQAPGVIFTANTGGFAGFQKRAGTIVSQNATEIRVLVPEFNAFVGPPPIVPPSEPFGFVGLDSGGGLAPPDLQFFFFEEPTLEIATVGQGTTQSGGMGRAVTTFNIDTGPPSIPTLASLSNPPLVFEGNDNFELRLENAMPIAPAVVLFGAPASLPYVPLGDGQLVVDLNGYVGLFAGVTDAQGDLSLPVPVPDTIHGTLMMQFLLFDGGTGNLIASSGLQALL